MSTGFLKRTIMLTIHVYMNKRAKQSSKENTADKGMINSNNGHELFQK